MKKIILIVVCLVIALSVSFVVICNNKTNKSLKNIKLLSFKDINNILVNYDLNKLNESISISNKNNNEIDKESSQEETIVKKEEKSKSQEKTTNSSGVASNNTRNLPPYESVVSKNNTNVIQQKSQEPTKKAKIDTTKQQVSNDEVKQVETTTETKQSEIKEEPKIEQSTNNSSNVETITTDLNGNPMNKEMCYKESVDIQFRKNNISSTGCFSTGKYNNNGEEIYYLDVRYQ